MTVRRLVTALVALAFVLALGIPPGPTQAAAMYGGMPCHAEGAPASADDGAAAHTAPSCCLPLCWLALEEVTALTGERLPPAYVSGAPARFVSASSRPLVPPPKRA